MGTESRVHGLLRSREAKALLRDILKEWALHVEVKNDPSVFATLYLEMLQNQKDSETRLFCAILFTLMSARPWIKMYGFLKRYCSREVTRIFKNKYAGKFYEGFRGMIHAQMQKYFKKCLKTPRRAKWRQTKRA